MPTEYIKNERFLMHWPPESDHTIMVIAIRFGRSVVWHYKDGRRVRRWVVNWKLARESGALKGLPAVSNREIAKRYGYLKVYYRDPDAYLEKKRISNRKFSKKVRLNYYERREAVWKNLQENVRRSYGIPPRNIWNNKQRKLLIKIIESHRKSSVTIDWVGVMSDKRVKKLPEKYHGNLYALRKYYWTMINRDDPEYIKKHRQDALKYKKENYQKYRMHQRFRCEAVSRAVNDILNDKIGKI